MSFIESKLSGDERIVYRAHVTNLFLLLPGLVTIVGILWSFIPENPKTPWIFRYWVLLIAIPYLISQYVRVSSIELALTNKRIVSKGGILKRFVMDTNLTRVEGIKLDQGLMGRIFNFGTIVIRGTGGDLQRLTYIAKPFEFQSAVNSQIDLHHR